MGDRGFPKFDAQNSLTTSAALREARGSGAGRDFVPESIALAAPLRDRALDPALVGNSQLFFYRRDLFEKHSLRPPATWDDVLAAARTIHEREALGAAGDGARVNGYVMRAAQGNAVVADFMPIFWAFGAEMFDAKGRPTVNSPEGVAALKFMLELGKYAPPGYQSFNADEVSAHLLQGTAAMSINWPAWISAFSDPARTKYVGLVGFGPMPGATKPGRAEIGNWLIAIPRASRNAEAAFDFLLWAHQPSR